jgi:hypothetical protein
MNLLLRFQKKQSIAAGHAVWKSEQRSSSPQKEYSFYAPESVERREFFSESASATAQQTDEQKKKSLFNLFE